MHHLYIKGKYTKQKWSAFALQSTSVVFFALQSTSVVMLINFFISFIAYLPAG